MEQLRDEKIEKTRYGAYAIVCRDHQLLLTKKVAGPYRGAWDLPGGGIEFAESPEEALRRELKEEVALAAQCFELLEILTHVGVYENICFHHIGLVYRAWQITSLDDCAAEEEFRWFSLGDVEQIELTPFATDVYIKQKNLILERKG